MDMPYQLILTVPKGSSEEYMLANAKTPTNAKFLYTYLFQAQLNQEQPTLIEMPIKLTLHNHTRHQNLQRCLQIFFSSQKAAKHFLVVFPQTQDLFFNTYQCRDAEGDHQYVVRIISNILSSTSFQTLQSLLISYFHLTEQSVKDMLALAGPLSDSACKSRENIKSQFAHTLKQTSAQDLDTICPRLIKEAKTFDGVENLGQNVITFSLGKLFLSHNLSQQAINAFEKIKKNMDNREYCLAQVQLAILYCTQDGTRTGLKKCFMAALESNDPNQASLCANLLCGFKSFTLFFTYHDFQYVNNSHHDKNPENETHVLFKMFEKIKIQQQEIKRLNNTLKSTNITTVSHSIPLVRSGFYAPEKTMEEHFMTALETNNPTQAAHCANLLCDFQSTYKLFSAEDFECITHNSDDDNEHNCEDQDNSTDVLFTIFDKIHTQEEELRLLAARIAATQSSPHASTSTTSVSAVMYTFEDKGENRTEIKGKQPPPPPPPLSSKRKPPRHPPPPR